MYQEFGLDRCLVSIVRFRQVSRVSDQFRQVTGISRVLFGQVSGVSRIQFRWFMVTNISIADFLASNEGND